MIRILYQFFGWQISEGLRVSQAAAAAEWPNHICGHTARRITSVVTYDAWGQANSMLYKRRGVVQCGVVCASPTKELPCRA